MSTLTIQFKRMSTGKWDDRTIVTVFDPAVLEAEITALVAELPKEYVARVKVETGGVVSYRW